MTVVQSTCAIKVRSPPAGHEKSMFDSAESMRGKDPVHGQSYVERKPIPGRRHMYQKGSEQYPYKSKIRPLTRKTK